MTFRSFLRIAPMLLHSRLKAKISPPLLLRRFYSTTTFDPPSSSDVETPSDPSFPRFNSEILDSSLLHSRLKAKISPPLLLRRFYSTTTFDPPSSSDDETPSDPSFPRFNSEILDSSPENEEYEDLTITQATPLVSPSIHPIGRYTVADVAERVGPSVVRVVVPSSDKRKKSQGSGFFIDRKRVLTCAHVVVDTDEEGEILSYPDKVVLKTHNGNFVDAKLLTHTVSLHYDIAVLEITSEETFQPVMFGNSRQVLLGGWVIAFGSPNYMDRTLSLGTINCIDRTDVELRLPKHKRIFYFQCDCMLNVGNMGGPLVDLEGNVIALISMAFVGGIGISVPIHTVRKFLKDKF